MATPLLKATLVAALTTISLCSCEAFNKIVRTGDQGSQKPTISITVYPTADNDTLAVATRYDAVTVPDTAAVTFDVIEELPAETVTVVQQPATVATPVATPEPKPATPPQPVRHKRRTPAQQPEAPAASVTPAHDREPLLANQIAGEWYISSVGTTTITGEDDMPYINFDTRTKRFYANNGCNVINGSFKLDQAAATITFHAVMSTMRYCGDISYDNEISGCLSDNSTLIGVITKRTHETQLALLDQAGRTVMVLRKHNMEFLNGNWQVVAINGVPIDDDEANVFFDINERRVHGNTGCNYFNGDIYIDPARANSIDLSNMGTTRMACPKTQQETAMLAALQSVSLAVPDSAVPDDVIMLDSNGHQVITLRRINTPSR